jgi:hypothetical protein
MLNDRVRLYDLYKKTPVTPLGILFAATALLSKAPRSSRLSLPCYARPALPSGAMESR